MLWRLVITVGVLSASALAAANDLPWRPFYEAGQWDPYVTAWIGDGTRSAAVDDGLLIVDESTRAGSGRLYQLAWQADPTIGARLAAKLRVKACGAPWGVCLAVADGVHEEGLTIYPDRLQLEHARRSVPFNAADGDHVYCLQIVRTDLRLWVDDRLVIDAAGQFTHPAYGQPPRNQCSFGSGSSTATGEAVWRWVRFESSRPLAVKPASRPLPGLTVTMGETIDLVPGATYGSLFRYRDGRLAVQNRLSTDGGRTWGRGAGPHTGAFEFADGEVIAPGFNTKRVSDGVFSVPLRRSKDGGRSFPTEQATLRIPNGTGGTGDDGQHYEGPCVDHAVVQRRDGSLLMAMYGYFTGDTVLCPAFPPEWKLYKYRTWVMRSVDRGRTWDYLATVAYDPQIGAESFCEADLLALPGGEILCFMRTGGEPPKHITPLYLCRSRDDGATWTRPEPIADRGVWPNACRLSDGTLALTYGRPGNWLAFSRDGGRTWGGQLCYYEGATTSYNTVEEVAPGRLLVVYDRTRLDRDGQWAKGLVGTFFTVQPTAP